jgi:HAD superfamily hydrolase (TIGR01509 family)
MTALFDLDGVILATEPYYTWFWDDMGRKYLGLEGFGTTIKGQTLNLILGQYVHDGSLAKTLVQELDEFESNMEFGFIPGALDFLSQVKDAGIPSAIVTSSNNKKMEKLYARYPEFKSMVIAVLTSEHFSKSKPDPECFLKGMEVLGGRPESTVVFEDSIHGLAAGRASGAYVVGLATTNSREDIEPLCDMVIDNFEGFNLKTDSGY